MGTIWTRGDKRCILLAHHGQLTTGAYVEVATYLAAYPTGSSPIITAMIRCEAFTLEETLRALGRGFFLGGLGWTASPFLHS